MVLWGGFSSRFGTRFQVRVGGLTEIRLVEMVMGGAVDSWGFVYCACGLAEMRDGLTLALGVYTHHLDFVCKQLLAVGNESW